MTPTRTTYTFGPLERRGLLGPVRIGQLLVLGAGLLSAIALLDAAPTAHGAVLALALLTLTTAVSVVPLGGRTLSDWTPVVLIFLGRRLGGGGRFVADTPTSGRRAPDGHGVVPPQLRGARIVEIPYGRHRVGALAEQSGRRLTAVLACRVLAFTLLDPEAQERRLARWGLVLSGAAGTAVRRLQWIERTAPAQGDELARWLHAERDPEVPLRGTPMIDSYLELIGSATDVSHEHEILLAVQVEGRREPRGAGRLRGGATHSPRPAAGGAVDALVEATQRVARGLEEAEIEVLGALGPDQLALTLRTAFDPYARSELAALSAADPDRPILATRSAWPVGAREHWDHYQCDGALHATYWVAGWPRIDVPAAFMDTLLGRSGAVRTVSVIFEPLAVERSTREIEAAVTRDRADRELRARLGQSETARQRQAQAATARRESELAAGHGEVRLSGFVTVSGRDAAELRRACAEVTDHAARARLELRRLYGQQGDAFTFTLPLCRGLR